MAAKSSSKLPKTAGASPLPHSSAQVLAPPAPLPSPVLTVKVLEDALEKHSQHLAEMIDEKMDEKLTEKFTVMREDILLAFQGMAICIERLDERVEDLTQNNTKLDAKILETENVVDKIDYDLTLVQYHEMEFAVRIRGLKENLKEDLKKLVSVALEDVLGRPAEEIAEDIDKIFRVNSWIARQRKLPRDVVVYFTKRAIRNEVIQVSYNTKLVIADQEVLVLKEIPPKILRKRKEFAFLAHELKRRDVRFRWEIPVGMVVMFEDTRYRLATVLQARDFYSNVLKAIPIPLLESIKEGKSYDAEGIQIDETAPGMTQISTVEEAKDQRVTRAASRRARRDQDQAQQNVVEPSKCTYSQAVGGARPKNVKGILEDALQKLRVARNGD